MLIKIIKKIIRKYRTFCDRILPKYFIKSKLLSSIYYLFFSSQFKREHHAVLVGKVKHTKESLKNKDSFYTLIRNIHRLEKGLLMRPRRDIFALDFIVETMNNYVTIFKEEDYLPNSQVKWVYDVLNEYFSVTGDHPVINKQRKIFEQTSFKVSITNKHSLPYKRLEVDKPAISYEDFYKLTKYRRSVRWFLNKKVPHYLIDKAILAANQSPSACNRQPFEYRVVDNPELLEKITSLPMGVGGYRENIPMMIVAVGNLDAYFDERDRHLIYIDTSLANMSLIFALETLGLSSCCINWPDIEELEKKMEIALKLEKHQRAIMCLAVGYPDPEGMVAFSEKRNLDLIRKFN
ncbi:nitroreductase family protein [Tamlana sp. 62-3]|uniref:Nitroreductase family protein n=1 Tax=Neotamlana sargassicola TaxID=2883125 RepID=A0A9X1L679_9FLAO|nr:nitroreductase family protein [Tamlana sargassicola]MCB4807304.1 nitroreductase family protein [Tamlana sargassicola]